VARCSSLEGDTASKVSPPAAFAPATTYEQPVGTVGTSTPPTMSLVLSVLCTFATLLAVIAAHGRV